MINYDQKRKLYINNDSAVKTRITHDGEHWLKENLGIDIEQLNKENASEYHAIDSRITHNQRLNSAFSGKFIHDRVNGVNDRYDVEVKRNYTPVRLEELNIQIPVLEALYLNKNMIINEMKKKVYSYITINY